MSRRDIFSPVGHLEEVQEAYAKGVSDTLEKLAKAWDEGVDAGCEWRSASSNATRLDGSDMPDDPVNPYRQRVVQ